MTNLTSYETTVLRAIAQHEMNSLNGDTPESHEDVATYCWADDFTGDNASCELQGPDVLTVPQVKGVLSSLSKKGLIHIVEGTKHDEPEVSFTETGFEAFQAVA